MPIKKRKRVRSEATPMIDLAPGDLRQIDRQRNRYLEEELIAYLPVLGEMGYGLLLQSLIDAATTVLRYHWQTRRTGKPLTDEQQHLLIEDKQDFAELYATLEKTIPQFEERWEAMLALHNKSAAENIIANEGKLFTFVIPKFKPDGSHEPPGDFDGPYNAKF